MRCCSKKSKGRQKVEMVKIQKESNLQVTFSKRRAGLFKKASELSTLCAAETAVVVFSPGNKPHSFGHPDVETVTNRFLNQNALEASDADKLLEAHRRASLNRQTLELNRLQHQLEFERKRASEMEGQRRRWWGAALDYAQLAQLEKALARFKDRFEDRAGLGLRRPGGGPGEYDGDSSILIRYSSSPQN